MTLLSMFKAKEIDLDVSVRHYLDLPIDPRITLRQLIMNTSGLGETIFAMPPARFNPLLEISPRDLVALALPQGQVFEPGHHFDYCNTGWVIAALAIEAVCAQPYGQVIERKILRPLGLTNTCFGGRAPTERMLHGYLSSPATSRWVDTAGCLSWAFGAGDGVASLDDILDLYASLARSGSCIGIELGDLNAITAKPSASPVFSLSIGAEYGLGIERRAWAGSEVWGHPGSTYSYLSGTWLDAARGVAVATCVTRAIEFPPGMDSELRYPRAQLFAMALNTAYALAQPHGS
jgi:D-alanyl-D-alanine carboxypeptidase